MIITNISFNSRIGEGVSILFDLTPIRFINPFVYYDKLGRSDQNHLLELIRETDPEKLKKFFDMTKEHIASSGMEKQWLCIYTTDKVPKWKYITPHKLLNSLDYSRLSLRDNALIRRDKKFVEEIDERNRDRPKRYAIHGGSINEQIWCPDLKWIHLERYLLKEVTKPLVLPSAWHNPALLKLYTKWSDDRMKWLRLYLTMYYYDGKPLVQL